MITNVSDTFLEIDHKIIFLRSFLSFGLVSVTSESMCMKYWLTA